MGAMLAGDERGHTGTGRGGIEQGDPAPVRERRGRPFDIALRGVRAADYTLGIGATDDRDAPEVPPFEISLIALDDEGRAVRDERGGFDLEVAGGQWRRIAAGRGHTIEVLPSVVFPGEHDETPRRPEQLYWRIELVEDTAASLGRVPDRASDAGGRIGQPDRPWLSGALGAEDRCARAGGAADEGDRAAIGRPRRVGIAVDRGSEVRQRVRGEIIDPNEAVRAAVAHEREAVAIGGPAEAGSAAARVGQLGRRCPRVGGRRPDLILDDVGDPIANRRHRWRVPLAQAARRASGAHTGTQGDRPHGLLDTGRNERGIGDLTVRVCVAAADIYETMGAGEPADIGDLLAIVSRVRRHLVRSV